MFQSHGRTHIGVYLEEDESQAHVFATDPDIFEEVSPYEAEKALLESLDSADSLYDYATEVTDSDNPELVGLLYCENDDLWVVPHQEEQ